MSPLFLHDSPCITSFVLNDHSDDICVEKKVIAKSSKVGRTSVPNRGTGFRTGWTENRLVQVSYLFFLTILLIFC